LIGSKLLADWDHGRMMNHGGTGWWPMALLMLLAVIATVVLVVWLVTRTGSGSSHVPVRDPNSRAREILAERLARGEIEPPEYQERLSHLG
jgi:putative membrane protein